MTKEIGKSGVTSAMESIGIDMSSESNVTNLSYAIGGWNKGISPVEMASAYATISNNGYILKVIQSIILKLFKLVKDMRLIKKFKTMLNKVTIPKLVLIW